MQTKVAVALCAVIASTPAAARCWKPGQNVSWYGEPQKLSDGSNFDPESETCASREYPKGTVLRVTDLDSGLAVECGVSDWGPNPWTNCKLDLSRKAAIRLGILNRGVARAKIEVINYPEKARQASAETSPDDFDKRWALTGLAWSKNAPATIYARMAP